MASWCSQIIKALPSEGKPRFSSAQCATCRLVTDTCYFRFVEDLAAANAAAARDAWRAATTSHKPLPPKVYEEVFEAQQLCR